MKKVLQKSMLLFVAILFAGIAQAQTVTGTVTEGNGPLPGANVIVKGTSNGTTTDFDGSYTLNDVPADATIVFSYVGYTTKEIAVAGQTTINTALASDNTLDEVVLIGYGSTTVKDATGSVVAVTSEDFNKGVISSPEQLIQGKTAGVQVRQSSGEPGAGITVNIRGSSSIRANNSPLFVVDGVPIGTGGPEATGDLGGLGGGAARNPLSFINPNDIESISILKDASATAIYGSRGANGVVIVQTKSGRGNAKGSFELSSSVSVSTRPDEYNLASRESFLSGVETITTLPAENFGFDTDWQDVIYRDAFSRQTDLSYSKSFDKGHFRAGGGYSNQFGTLESTGQERIVGRINGQYKFFDDKLTLSLQSSISRINNQSAPNSATAGFNGDVVGSALIANPTWPNDPNFNPGNGALTPSNLLGTYLGESNTNRYLANLTTDYKITDNLSAKVTLGYDESDSQTVTLFTSESILGGGVQGNGRGTLNNILGISKLLEGTLNYKKDFGNIQIDLLGGYSYQEFRFSGVGAQAFGLSGTNRDSIKDDIIDTYDSLNGAIPSGGQVFGFDSNQAISLGLDLENQVVVETPITNSFNRSVQALVADKFRNIDELQSVFFRGNATISDKYLVTATFRADGSTRFGDGNQYGYFPSGAFAWQLHKEDFIGDAFSTLKLRLGAGLVGNQEGLGFANFLSRTGIAGGFIDNNGDAFINNGTTIFGSSDPDLKWENTIDFNLGVDFGFNNDRFNGTLNVYRKETDDQLLRINTAAPASSDFVFTNLPATVTNQGIELSLNYDFIQTDDWDFGANFNIAYNENEVDGLGDNFFLNTGEIRGQGLTNAFVQRLADGESLFSFYLPVFEGFDADGQPIYEDIDGNGVGDPSLDKEFVDENALPEVTAGLSLNLRYKRLSLNTFLSGQFGFSVYNATANAFFNVSNPNSGRNTLSSILDDVTVVNGTAIGGNGEAAGTSADTSTRFLESGDFVRLESASLSYDFPLSGDGLFDSLIFSFTGQNLFLITDYSGLDPEVSSQTGDLGSGVPTAGIDYAAIPRARTFVLGVNAKF